LIAMPGGQVLKRVGHRERTNAQRLRSIAQVEPQSRKHLIVPRASRMQAAAARADARGE
jgi:hypothetical protein